MHIPHAKRYQASLLSIFFTLTTLHFITSSLQQMKRMSFLSIKDGTLFLTSNTLRPSLIAS